MVVLDPSLGSTDFSGSVRLSVDFIVSSHTTTHLIPHPVTLLYTPTQITKTDKIKAMSKKQLRQIKKTQVRSTHIRDRHAAITIHPVATRHPNKSDRTAHSHPTNSHTNAPDEPAGRGGAGLAVGRPEAGRAARATEEALGEEGQEAQVLISGLG